MHFCHIAASGLLTHTTIAFYTLHYGSVRCLVLSRTSPIHLCCKTTMQIYCRLTNCTANSPETGFAFSFLRHVKSWVGNMFSILHSYFHCLSFRGCRQELEINLLITNQFRTAQRQSRSVLCESNCVCNSVARCWLKK